MLADLERAIDDRPEPHALQPHHGVADGLAHVADLPCAAFVQGDRHQRLIFARAQAGLDQPHRGGRGPAAPNHHAAPQPLERAVVGHAAHACVVLAFDLVARVQQARREVPVVG